MSLSGGSEQTTFYVAGHFQNEVGVYLNNYMNQISLVGNVHNRVRNGLDIGVNTRYTSSDLHLPDNDNNALGYLGSGLLGSAFGRNGWGFLQPNDVRKINTDQSVNRFTGSVNTDATPFSWLTIRSVVGLDFTNRFDQRTLAPNQVPFNTTSLEGSRSAREALQRSAPTSPSWCERARAATVPVRFRRRTPQRTSSRFCSA